jgi:glycosyltransferase involved in cell wall biosynthesis
MFSIVITTYNRKEIVSRCIESCLAQTLHGAQVVVVDDASVDDTVASLSSRWDDEIDLVVHTENRGINPARHSGVTHARGEWIVVLDSDWELAPHALERFRELIRALPPDVRAIRTRMEWDSGRVSPAFMPDGVVGYVERIRWAEREGGFDSLVCIHRSAFEHVPYIQDRRGTVEELYELDLAKVVNSLYAMDVLGKQYFDAPNSYLRTVRPQILIPQLLGDAHDLLWMAETVLQRHGSALREHGPRQLDVILRIAGTKALLVGDRSKGRRYLGWFLRRNPSDAQVWFTLTFGAFGPKVLAYATLAYRFLRRA